MNNIVNLINYKSNKSDSKEVEKKFSINCTVMEVSKEIGVIYEEFKKKHPDFTEKDLNREFVFLLVKHSAILAGAKNACSVEEVVDRWKHYYDFSKKRRK